MEFNRFSQLSLFTMFCLCHLCFIQLSLSFHSKCPNHLSLPCLIIYWCSLHLMHVICLYWPCFTNIHQHTMPHKFYKPSLFPFTFREARLDVSIGASSLNIGLVHIIAYCILSISVYVFTAQTLKN